MTGIIDRDGNFYECEPYEHNLTAIRYFHMPFEILLGFIKVINNLYYIEDAYARYPVRPTVYQLKKLIELGVILHDDDFEQYQEEC